MSKKIMRRNFAVLFRRFMIISLIIVILGGALNCFSFRTQISEIASHAQAVELAEQAGGDEHDEKAGIPPLQLTKPSAADMVLLCAYALACVLIVLAYWVIVAEWLYQAALCSGMNGAVWLISGLCLNFIAVGAFIVILGITRVKCPDCGCRQRKGTHFCSACGAPLYGKCPICGADCEKADRFCRVCGAMIIKNEA